MSLHGVKRPNLRRKGAQSRPARASRPLSGDGFQRVTASNYKSLLKIQEPGNFRWCHACGKCSHSIERPVERCEHCQKWLAPFFYITDEPDAIASADEQRAPPKADWRPLVGISAVWT